MKTIPTAAGIANRYSMTSKQKEAIIRFAKNHVESALKEASIKAETFGVSDGSSGVIHWSSVNKKSILNSYPLTNIK